MEKIKVITSNKHKFFEISETLENTGVELIHINMAYPEIQAPTIKAVALQSATTLMSYIDPPFLIEDSGLEIEALKGFPGPYSSFVYKTIGWKGILKIMDNLDKREARFISFIVLVDENNKIHFFEGVQTGKISKEGKGDYGFGFDPIFVPTGQSKTFAQMDIKTKNYFSHRGFSSAKLKEFLIKECK